MKYNYLIFILLVLGCKTKNDCDNPVNVQLLGAYSGDSLDLVVDDSIKFSQLFDDRFIISMRNRKILVNDVCIDKDSFQIRVGFNRFDTSFFIVPSNVKSIIVGEGQILFEYRNPNDEGKNAIGFD